MLGTAQTINWGLGSAVPGRQNRVLYGGAVRESPREEVTPRTVERREKQPGH